MNPPNPKKQQAKVDAWNAANPIGIEVLVRLDDGSTLKTKTRAPASLLGGHTAVAWLEDISGCYLLDRCTALEKEAA
jgi:hypothetical protein